MISEENRCNPLLVENAGLFNENPHFEQRNTTAVKQGRCNPTIYTTENIATSASMGAGVLGKRPVNTGPKNKRGGNRYTDTAGERRK